MAVAGRDDAAAFVGAVLERRWRLTRVIGEGGLGIVFAAESTEGEAVRAVKILRREFAEDETIVARFLTEARASTLVSHPRIVRVEEGSRAEDGTPYLVMELVSGMSLGSRIRRGRLPADQATKIGEQLLSALEAAHGSGVMHRDLKPDNIMLVEETPPTIKVLDFGLARVIDEAGGIARQTKTGMLLGSPGYMSPEQVRNAKEVDARTDLWSVGVMLFEMLSGTLPFTGETDLARLTAVMTTDPLDIESVAPQYSHWKAFFDRALARDVRERYQLAGDMLEALRATASGQPAPAPLAPAPEVPRSLPPSVETRIDTAVSPDMPEGVVIPPAPEVRVIEVKRPFPAALVVGIVALVTLVVGVAIGLAVSR